MKTEKMYTFKDVAEMTGMSLNGVRQRFFKSTADKSHIQRHIIYDRCGNKHTEMLLTAQQIAEFNLLPRSRKSKDKENQKKSIFEEQDPWDHKLVTDSRFLKLSYFPDVVLVCFLDMEEV